MFWLPVPMVNGAVMIIVKWVGQTGCVGHGAEGAIAIANSQSNCKQPIVPVEDFCVTVEIVRGGGAECQCCPCSFSTPLAVLGRISRSSERKTINPGPPGPDRSF